jgi:hypothetical protein
LQSHLATVSLETGGAAVVKRKLVDVFKTVGLPPYTYVKPPYFGQIRIDVEQPGKHLLVEGPSGIGKSCIIFKILEELALAEGRDFAYVTCRDADSPSKLEEFLAPAAQGKPVSPSLLVLDDFHLLPLSTRTRAGSYLKQLSDKAFTTAKPPKVVLIGIPAAGMSLLSEALDLGPRLGSYRLPRASDDEIRRVISEGEKALNVIFEDEGILLSEIDGNFWLAQYICSKVCSSESVFETCEPTRIISYDLLTIRKHLMNELQPKYLPTAVSFSKGKRWRPVGNKPYLEILVALSKIPESVITFDKVLNLVPERRKPGIRAVKQRVAEVIFDHSKAVDLRKQLAFDSDCFSIEDPLFRYFLNNIDLSELYRTLGIERDAIDAERIYSYDIGFSFAGETRQMVEAVNSSLKEEDVVTFYDYDQQAFLLALDLESTLARIYSSSCRYYMVFLDDRYSQKVWTKYERDIMTKPGRVNHIIPVVLDDAGAAGIVGVSKTVGRVDLRDVWKTILSKGHVDNEDLKLIRNRCVLPILEKLDTPEVHSAV